MTLLGSGPVPPHSALAGFLADEVLANRLGVSCARPRFRLSRLGESAVLRCDEETTGVRLALKSYSLKWIDGRQGDHRHQLRVKLMRREYRNIQLVRQLGLDRPPLRAVRAVATNPDLGCLLVEEFVDGPDLCAALRGAARQEGGTHLDIRLGQLASFLARLHNASATDEDVDDEEPLRYLNKVVDQLLGWGVITVDEKQELQRIARAWADTGTLIHPGDVLIHGDATPAQFLFPSAPELVVVDFERLHRADRAADIGRVAGEIKHLLTLHTGDPWYSEPYIGRFYKGYHRQAPGSGDFASLTHRARFHMACSELRIARNSWVGFGHRRWLVEEAMRCLRL